MDDAPTLESVTFGSLDITFDPRVLRPREWTVQQSAWAAELSSTAPAGPMLELCSGAGQIGLLAAAMTDRSLVCVDVDPTACEFAELNTRAAGLTDRVEIRQSDFWNAFSPDEMFSLVIADPPWVCSAHVGRHPGDPLLAIDGGDDGLDLARRCLVIADQRLVPGGSVILQVGTRPQVEILRQELTSTPGTLQVMEIRELPGGVLARLDRLPTL